MSTGVSRLCLEALRGALPGWGQGDPFGGLIHARPPSLAGTLPASTPADRGALPAAPPLAGTPPADLNFSLDWTH